MRKPARARRLEVGRALAVAVMVVVLSAAAPSARAAEKNAALAIDLAGVSYWGQEWIFVDLVKRCKNWSGEPGKKYTVDENGWINWLAPGERGIALVGDTDAKFPRNFPLGRYVALYDGEGRVTIECRKCKEVSRAPGRVVVDVIDSNYVWIVINAVKPKNHLRNLRVVPIEFEKTYLTQPFHPKYLEGLRPFAGIRYSGAQNTNGNPHVRWAERTKPTAAFQDAVGGVALEYMVRLANATATDPWFCIPPRADDDYVARFARTVFSNLDPDRKVYLEYGNEIWNDGYPYAIDGAWITQHARERQIPLSPGDDRSDMTYRLRYQVYRSREIFEIFRREMASLGIDSRRLVRVIASQSVYFDRVKFTLDYRFPDGTFGYQHADALAVAPYFGSFGSPRESELAENKWTVNQILDYADCAVSQPAQLPAVCAGIPRNSIADVIQTDSRLARERGLRLLGYEGGQHLVAWNGHPDFVEKLATVNRAPRMKDIYRKYLDTWRAGGGELLFLVDYVQPYSQFGYWGMLEAQDQPLSKAPKLAACLDFLATQRPWWNDPWPRKDGVRSDAGAPTDGRPAPR